MRALVVYESMYGNTRDVAKAVADGLATRMPVQLTEVGAAPTILGDDIGLLVVGAPTHAHGMSKPDSRESAEHRVGEGEPPVVSGGVGLRGGWPVSRMRRRRRTWQPRRSTHGSRDLACCGVRPRAPRNRICAPPGPMSSCLPRASSSTDRAARSTERSSTANWSGHMNGARSSRTPCRSDPLRRYPVARPVPASVV